MRRAAWLQDRRMQKFVDVLCRWEQGHLSMMEAGELLGMSERQFRRYRERYEDDGAAGLVDGRLGKPSPKRVPAVDVQLMLDLYRGPYRGWNVRHFHEHLVRDHNFRWGYTWTKTQLHTAGLVERNKKRGVHRNRHELPRRQQQSAGARVADRHPVLAYGLDDRWDVGVGVPQKFLGCGPLPWRSEQGMPVVVHTVHQDRQQQAVVDIACVQQWRPG